MTTLHLEPTLEPALQPRSAELRRPPGPVERLVSWVSTLRVGPVAAVVGSAAALITWLGSWNPSYWGDEAATVVSAERPLAALFAELHNIDGVHGLYYLLMHFWIDAFGASELSTRTPSALGVGFLVAGTVVLGARLIDVRFGILAGLVCTVLPRTTFLATEARSSALATAAAVWVTVVFVGLWRRRDQRLKPWLVYGALVGLSSYLFFYLFLMIVVHGAVLASSRRGRELLGRWVRAGGMAVLVAAPFAVLAIAQHNQVAFLARPGYVTPITVFVSQWFGSPPAHGPWLVPILCWGLILLGVGIVAGHAIRARVTPAVDPRTAERELVRLGVIWLVLPTALLLLGDAVVAPMYNNRYLAFCTPAAALLIAGGALAVARVVAQVIRRAAGRAGRARPPRRSVIAVVAIALAVALGAVALPGFLAQRGPFAKDGGSDWRQVADYVGAHAVPGDAIIFDSTTKPSRQPELAYRMYPAQFAAVDPVALVTPFSERAQLWDVLAPLSQVRPALAASRDIWALELPSTGVVPRDITDLTAHGYRVVSAHRIHRTVVYQLKEGS
jgi:mannosyltransferase